MTNVFIIGDTLTEDNPAYIICLGDFPAFDVHLGTAAAEHHMRVRRGVFNSSGAPSTKAATTIITTTRAPSPSSSSLNVTLEEETDHTYYKSRLVTGKEAIKYFVNYEEMKKHGLITHVKLSASHRTAVTMHINFTFPFYGYDVRNVTIATGGFLYMSDFKHQWLTTTQYIAPLMANFDTTIGNESLIHYADNGTALIVLWENVQLQDNVQAGPFTFEVILHMDGNIIFSYYQVPINVSSISVVDHPVNVGLSDAYYIDRQTGNGSVNQRTIYEYNRVKITTTEITSQTAIIFTPLPTCNIYKTCSECLTASNNFKCLWCPAVGRCSSGLDRKRQEWLESNCHLVDLTVDQCPNCSSTMSSVTSGLLLSDTATSLPTTARSSSTANSVPTTKSLPTAKSSPTTKSRHSSGAKPGVIVAILLSVCLVGGLTTWFL